MKDDIDTSMTLKSIIRYSQSLASLILKMAAMVVSAPNVSR